MAVRAHESVSSLRKKLLKKFLLGIKRSNAASESMSVYDRKRAIKLSSDVAMASTRRGSIWRKALINQISKQGTNKHMLMSIVGGECIQPKTNTVKNSKMVVRRSGCISRRAMRRSTPKPTILLRRPISSSTIAKMMQKRRTKLLKCVVPGGESMDEVSLLEETADYIVSLRAQIDVMRHLTKVFTIAN